MYKKIILSYLLVIVVASMAIGQSLDDKIIFQVADEKVTVDEFLTVYNKNNYENKKATEEDLREYLDLYVKFKLKVKEAYSHGMDTNQAFISELAGYRTQLAQPYLTDKSTNESLLKEAYDRMQFEIKARHVLLRLSENASPKDSLKVFKRIDQLRRRVLKGESFEKVASEFSEDPSAADNGGNLGYFSALRMIYPFENAAYTAKIDEVSPIFRTRFGYHFLKVEDKREARGEIKCAHIMVSAREGEPQEKFEMAQEKINEIYKLVLSKEQSFSELAKQYSEDPATAGSGGELPFFSSGRMVESFEEVAFNLKSDGDISKPVQTKYGYHIIKRIAKKGIPPFEEARLDLKAKIERDSRAYLNRNRLISTLKEQYRVQIFPKPISKLISFVDTTFMEGKWSSEKAGTFKETVLSISGKEFGQLDFANYIQRNQSASVEGDQTIILQKMFNRFQDDAIIDYEDSRLEAKYPDFKALMKEYKDGILLFELTDREVWSKAVEDTSGLEKFHELNSGKYMWGERLQAAIYTCTDNKTALAVKKLAKKKKYTHNDLLTRFNESNALNLRIDQKNYSKEDHPVLSKIEWKKGISELKNNNGSVVFVKVFELLPPQPKEISEIRGLVTSDYQNYLESHWIEDLKKKYPVTVNLQVVQEVLNRL